MRFRPLLRVRVHARLRSGHCVAKLLIQRAYSRLEAEPSVPQLGFPFLFELRSQRLKVCMFSLDLLLDHVDPFL